MSGAAQSPVRGGAQRSSTRSVLDGAAQRSTLRLGGRPAELVRLGEPDPSTPSGLHRCSLMREDFSRSLTLSAQATRTAGRKRRLNRGIDRWVRDVLNSWRAPRGHRDRTVPAGSSQVSPRVARAAADSRGPLPTEKESSQRHPVAGRRRERTVALVLLTGQPSLDAAYGAARRFWKRLRDRWPELTYFCWLELTEKGAPHYHAMVVNPPRGFYSRETKAWLERCWGNRFVKLKWRDADWFARAAGAYVGSYTKKWGDKATQQNYDDVPRELRTFMSNRTAHTCAELQEHESKWIATYCDRADVDGRTRPVDPYIRLDGQWRHTCGPGLPRYVTKSEDLRRRRRPRRLRRTPGAGGGPPGA